MDLVEIHFSYRDLDLEPTDFFEEKSEKTLIVHSPELFEGDHLMDLTSNQKVTGWSISELQRVVDRTRQLKEFSQIQPSRWLLLMPEALNLTILWK